MNKKRRNQVIGLMISFFLMHVNEVPVFASQEIPRDSKNSDELIEDRKIFQKMNLEGTMDGTLVDGEHETLKRMTLEFLEQRSDKLPNDFCLPIKSGFNISSGTWHYGSSYYGRYHLGVDFAAPISTEVVAVADGVIIGKSNACPTVGKLRNMCGYPGTEGGGNQLYLLTKVENTCYVVKYLHLKQDSLLSIGSLVKQGEKIAEVGSSGNSSGPHVHVEIFRLKEETMSDFLNEWDGNLSFHIGFGKEGFENRCSVKKDAPCREKPEDILNLK